MKYQAGLGFRSAYEGQGVQGQIIQADPDMLTIRVPGGDPNVAAAEAMYRATFAPETMTTAAGTANTRSSAVPGSGGIVVIGLAALVLVMLGSRR